MRLAICWTAIAVLALSAVAVVASAPNHYTQRQGGKWCKVERWAFVAFEDCPTREPWSK